MDEEFSYDTLFRQAIDKALEHSGYAACQMIVEAEVGQWKAATDECIAAGELPVVLHELDHWPVIQANIFKEGDVAIELPPIPLLDICRAYIEEWSPESAGLVAWMLRKVADEIEKPT
jgi:hypothetical protein